MVFDPFAKFSNEKLEIHVEDEEQWDKLLDILANEEWMFAGFDRDEFRTRHLFYIYYDVSCEEVHCRRDSYCDLNSISFDDMVEIRWPHLSGKNPMCVNIGELF